MVVKALLLDIEGTIASIAFVKDELFPYAYNNVQSFLQENKNDEKLQNVITDLVDLSKQEHPNDTAVKLPTPESLVSSITHNVQHWIKIDKKLTALKELQGLIWESAYKKGDVKGHLYDEVVEVLEAVRKQSIPIFIYSSGSVYAQKLLFSHSIKGDVTPLLNGYFDTKIGLKGEKSSYEKISKEIGVAPEEILFLTDIEAEARAACSAGCDTRILVRPGNAPLSAAAVDDFKTISDIKPVLEMIV